MSTLDHELAAVLLLECLAPKRMGFGRQHGTQNTYENLNLDDTWTWHVVFAFNALRQLVRERFVLIALIVSLAV